MTRSLPTLIWFALIAMLLSGCGFKLRSYELSSNVESFYLSGDTRILIYSELRRGLLQAGAKEAASATDAALIVELLDQRRERRNASTSGTARVAEYEMELAVYFRVLDQAQQELEPARWVSRQRVFRVDRDNIVGNSEEQSLIEREMRAELVQAVVRSLNALAQNLDAAQT